MTEVSAKTEDLDAFTEHGASLQAPLRSEFETLVRQRNFLVAAGLPNVVETSEVGELENIVVFMSDLDQFVSDISTALKDHGDVAAFGVSSAPARIIDLQLGGTDEDRLDDLEDALREEGFSDEDARNIRDEVAASLNIDPRYELDGAAVSEPGELAEAIMARAEDRASGLVDGNHVTSSSLHGSSYLSVTKLANDLYYGENFDGLSPESVVTAALQEHLSDEQWDDLQEELGKLEEREVGANFSLIGDHSEPIVIDDDLSATTELAAELYEDNRISPGMHGGGMRFDEAEVAYQLQILADHDPADALAVKWMLDSMMTPDEQADLNKVLSEGGSWSQRVDQGVRHPRDGVVGAAKGTWNGTAGWVLDYFADATVAATYGAYAYSTGSAHRSPFLGVPNVPTWEEIDDVVELEFEYDNIAQQGGADIAFAIEVGSAVYGLGKAGLTVVRVGSRYFLRSGRHIVAEVGPELTKQLDEGVQAASAARRVGDEASAVLTQADEAVEIADDVVVIREQDYRPVYAPGRMGHATDGNVVNSPNGIQGSGGHYIRSTNVRVLTVTGTDSSGVIQSTIAVRGPRGVFHPKLRRDGVPQVHTFFPPRMSRREVEEGIRIAFKNSNPVFSSDMPDAIPRFWEGYTPNGVLVTGRYKVPGQPHHGWSSAYPVYGG